MLISRFSTGPRTEETRRGALGNAHRADYGPGVIAASVEQQHADVGTPTSQPCIRSRTGISGVSPTSPPCAGRASQPLPSVPSPDVVGLWHANTLPKALAVVPFAISAWLVTIGCIKLMATLELRLASVLLAWREPRSQDTGPARWARVERQAHAPFGLKDRRKLCRRISRDGTLTSVALADFGRVEAFAPSVPGRSQRGSCPL